TTRTSGRSPANGQTRGKSSSVCGTGSDFPFRRLPIFRWAASPFIQNAKIILFCRRVARDNDRRVCAELRAKDRSRDEAYRRGHRQGTVQSVMGIVGNPQGAGLVRRREVRNFYSLGRLRGPRFWQRVVPAEHVSGG